MAGVPLAGGAQLLVDEGVDGVLSVLALVAGDRHYDGAPGVLHYLRAPWSSSSPVTRPPSPADPGNSGQRQLAHGYRPPETPPPPASTAGRRAALRAPITAPGRRTK